MAVRVDPFGFLYKILKACVIRWNRGRGRKIPRHEMHEGLKVHRSVKTRLEASHRLEEEYVPQIRPELKKFVNGKKVKEAKRLTHEDWNVEDPKYWEWVD